MTALPNPSPLPGSPSQTLLLVVEDQDLVLRSVSSRLYEAGYRVATCPSLPIALEFLEHDRSRLVILRADGFYLHGDAIPATIRSLSTTTRVLFLDVEGDYFLLLEPLATHLLIHPFERAQLPEAIREILGAAAGESDFGTLPLPPRSATVRPEIPRSP